MPKRLSIRLVSLLPLLALAACGGKSGANPNVVKIDVPTPKTVNIVPSTLQPGPTDTPTPTQAPPTPTPLPTPTPVPVSRPRGATVTSSGGTQHGDVGSYCWSQHVGGPSDCVTNDPPAQTTILAVKQKEKVLLKIDAQAPPNDESIRPFQGTRANHPDQQIDPALETELTIDLPKGTWEMDLCATWHGHGQTICWLFKFDVQ